MRFSCDGCGAHYMIPDDKVGPGGVKVRCKRCSHVVLVKPAPAAEPGAGLAASAREPEQRAPPSLAAPEGAGAAGAGGEGGGREGRAEGALDDELGHAFDSAFGGGSLGAALGDRPEPEPDDPAPAATAAAEQRPPPEPPAPEAPVEWYVAIGDAQVGPLLVAGVKSKWESGEVGPDTLVWTSGMADWSPLSSVPDLARLLAPVQRSAARPAARPAEAAAAEPGRPAAEEPARAAGVDSGWKPAAASALAALASEELASVSRAEPEKRPAGSLLDKMELPEGGADPTGMLPLRLRIDNTGETLLDAQPGEDLPRRPIDDPPPRRGRSRWLAVGIGAGAGLAAVALALVLYPKAGGDAPRPPAAPLAAPAPQVGSTPVGVAPIAVFPQTAGNAAPAAPAPTPPPPSTAGAVQSPPETAPAPQPTVAAAPAPSQPEPQRAAREERAAEPQRREAPAKSGARARADLAKAKGKAKPEKRAAVARAEPAPRAQPKGATGDPLLDVGGGDDDLAKDLAGAGGGAKKRSVYVPPAPGSDLPESVSDPRLIEAVTAKRQQLAACVDEQRLADPSVRGTLMLRWNIAPDGSVRDLRNLSPEYAKQPVVACISGVVKGIRFPKSQSGRDVEAFPFVFNK